MNRRKLMEYVCFGTAALLALGSCEKREPSGASKPFGQPAPQQPLAPRPTFSLPDLPEVERLSPSVDLFNTKIGDGRVWLYAPYPRGDRRLPLVLIAPAGGNLIEGMNLSIGDRREHLPYLAAGFAVLAYALDGDSESGHPGFALADGGLVYARNAFNFAKERVPFVDMSRVFAAGHSSAGDVAILFAAHEPSLLGVAAFNTSAEGCWFHTPLTLKLLRKENPGLPAFCQRTRAANHLGHLSVPMFLFSSTMDEVVPEASVDALARTSKLAGDRLDENEVGR